jgi:hypothetical protein
MASKRCFKCGLEKDLDEFYHHPQTADRHLNKCKWCAMEDIRLYRRNNPVAIKAADQRKYAKAKHYMAEYHKRMKALHPEKYRARNALSNAVRDGRLEKPASCSVCNRSGVRLDGHHFDYSKPLEVVWCCVACHRVLDGRIVQYKLPQSKENPNDRE